MRSAHIQRKTNETDIALAIDLDSDGSSIDCPVGFLTHMLELFSRHGGFFLDLAETDTYGQRGRRNGKTVFDDTTRGGVFLDHKQAPDEAVGIAFFWEEAKIKHGYWKENLE